MTGRDVQFSECNLTMGNTVFAIDYRDSAAEMSLLT